MDHNQEFEIGFLIELVISGEADEPQFEEVMNRIENDPDVAMLYRQACAERELMGSEIAREAMAYTQSQIQKMEQERIEIERSNDLSHEM